MVSKRVSWIGFHDGGFRSHDPQGTPSPLARMRAVSTAEEVLGQGVWSVAA
jgi:hypothetical protein